FAQRLVVSRAIVGTAHRIQFERPSRDSNALEKRCQQFQDFRVTRGRFASGGRRTENLGANLEELAVATFLRALAAKLRSDVEELVEPAIPELVLDVSAHHTGGVFRAKCEGLALSLSARPRSSHVNISFETMSVSSPTPRANSSVDSKMGVRI